MNKPVSDYYEHKSGRISSTCCICEAIRQKKQWALNPEQRERKSEYHRLRYADPIEKERQRAVKSQYFSKFAQKERDKANQKNLKSKKMAIEYAGGKCVCCGYDKCEAAFDFHHINPSEKEHCIAVILRRSWELAKKEIDKCVLLCVLCHRELHAGARFLPDHITNGISQKLLDIAAPRRTKQNGFKGLIKIQPNTNELQVEEEIC